VSLACKEARTHTHTHTHTHACAGDEVVVEELLVVKGGCLLLPVCFSLSAHQFLPFVEPTRLL